MNKSISILTLLLLLTANLAYSQSMADEEVDDKGFYPGAFLMGTSFDVEVLNDDPDTGGGIALEVGYNFNTNFAFSINVNGLRISPENGDNYGIAHFDLGVEGRLGNSESSFRPYGRALY